MAQPPGNNDLPPDYEEATKPGASFASPPPQAAQAQQPPPQQPPTNPQQPQQFIQQPTPIYIQQNQPRPGQTVILQPGGQQAFYVAQPNVVFVHPIKVAPYFDPYTEVCPYCNVSVVTRRMFVNGSMSCLFIMLGIFFPIFFCFLCCDTYKDANHYCPRCNRLIAIKRR